MSNERDLAYGRHSNIPECCIQFYMEQWEEEMQCVSQYYMAVKWSTYNYVPCPKCFAVGRKVRLVDCAADCGKECWREYD